MWPLWGAVWIKSSCWLDSLPAALAVTLAAVVGETSVPAGMSYRLAVVSLVPLSSLTDAKAPFHEPSLVSRKVSSSAWPAAGIVQSTEIVTPRTVPRTVGVGLALAFASNVRVAAPGPCGPDGPGAPVGPDGPAAPCAPAGPAGPRAPTVPTSFHLSFLSPLPHLRAT